MNNKLNRTNKRSKARKPNRKPKNLLQGAPTLSIRGGKIIPNIAPEHIDVALKYVDATLNRNNATNAYLYFRMRANGGYDPDPALGSGAMSGFAEWCSLYRKYLVFGVKITWDVTNLESFPVTIICGPSITDQNSVIVSAHTALDLAENKMYRKHTLSAAGGMDHAVLKYTLDLGQFLGNKGEWDFSGQYAGVGGPSPSNPTAITFLNFAAAANSVFVNGLYQTLRITYFIRFYELASILDRSFFERLMEMMREAQIEDDSQLVDYVLVRRKSLKTIK